MNTENILKSLNLTAGEVLTLEKAKDRFEFEALPVLRSCIPNFFPEDCCKGGGTLTECGCHGGSTNSDCGIDQPCGAKVPDCAFDVITPCECKGPVGYHSQNECHPFKDCPSNHCKPVQ